MLKANPWLGGVLEKRGKGIGLVYDEIDINELLFLNPDGLNIHSKLSYEEITGLAEAYIVKTPKKMLNTQEKVCSLVLSKNSDHSFSMIFSVSHSVVDGHAYYQLLNMLSEDKEISSLSVKRKYETTTQIKNAVGRDTYDYFVGVAHVFNALFGMAVAKRAKVFAYYLDKKKIADIKNAHNDFQSCEYLSTNDILTSSYGVFTKVRLLLMAINFRGKLKILNDKDAGNYEAVVLYDEKTYAKPSGIRQTLATGEPYRGLVDKLPSFFEGIRCKMGLITNWSTFSKELCFTGCKEALHLPLNHACGKMPYEFAIVFRAKGTDIGVLYYTNRFGEEDFTSSDLPIKNCISKEIFSDHTL